MKVLCTKPTSVFWDPEDLYLGVPDDLISSYTTDLLSVLSHQHFQHGQAW